MPKPREFPTWIRILLNASGPLGVGLALLGILSIGWGFIFLAAGLLYISWEIYPSAHKLTKRRRALSLFIFLGVGAVMGFFAWLLVLKSNPKPNELLQIVLQNAISTGDQRFWKLSGDLSDSRSVLCSAGVLMYLTITNRSTEDLMIGNLTVEVERNGGGWGKLTVIDGPSNSLVFAGIDISHLIAYRADFLDQELRGHNLRQGETVRGWLLMNFPRGENTSTTKPLFKIAAYDVGGTRVYESVLTGVDIPFQEASLTVALEGLQNLKRFKNTGPCGGWSH